MAKRICIIVKLRLPRVFLEVFLCGIVRKILHGFRRKRTGKLYQWQRIPETIIIVLRNLLQSLSDICNQGSGRHHNKIFRSMLQAASVL